MSNTISVGINGSCGRMGQRIVHLCACDPELTIGLALERPEHPKIGHDIGILSGIEKQDISLTTEISHSVDCIIDFSLPEAAIGVTESCEKWSIPLVMATTGLSSEQRARVESASQSIPVLLAPNMSLAVNLLMKLVRDAALALNGNSDGVDVEILERHHRFKEDAPSGTALEFGNIISQEMGQTTHAHGREGRPGARPANEIGYHAIRTGDNVGQHTIVFGLMGETLELAHRAQTRDCYARGAIMAAKFLAGQPAGMYSMENLLFP